jgi:hypothetical protein
MKIKCDQCSHAYVKLLTIFYQGVSSEMLQSKAYIHQYTKYGLQEDDFYDAFHSINSIIHNYNDM